MAPPSLQTLVQETSVEQNAACARRYIEQKCNPDAISLTWFGKISKNFGETDPLRSGTKYSISWL